MKSDTVDVGQRTSRPLLRDDDGARQLLDDLEERIRRGGIELGRRLVEQQELRAKRERGRERDALQLASGQLGRLPAGQVLGADERQRFVDPRPDLRRLGTEILEPEGDLVRDSGHHDLILRVLEDRRHRAGEQPGSGLAGVEARDDDGARERAAVKVRHEPGKRAEQARLARARRTEQGDVFALGNGQRDVAQHRLARVVGEGEVLDAGYSHSAPTMTIATATTSAARSRFRHGALGARVRPGRP